jgi:hypothetical protein
MNSIIFQFYSVAYMLTPENSCYELIELKYDPKDIGVRTGLYWFYGTAILEIPLRHSSVSLILPYIEIDQSVWIICFARATRHVCWMMGDMHRPTM